MSGKLIGFALLALGAWLVWKNFGVVKSVI